MNAEKTKNQFFSSGYWRVANSYHASRGLPARSAQAGVTLIDTLVGTALMLVIFLGITAAFQLSIDVVTNNKARAGAIALGNERLEYIRSLSYDQVAVEGGIPAGSIPHTESVGLNGITYTRRTLVLYADDPKDGLGASDENGVVADYKEAKVEVSWEARTSTRRMSLATRVSPPGIESAVPGGVLALSVEDANAQPVSNAQVHIVNALVNPAVDILTYTDLLGAVDVIGAPAGSGYEITISKAGYTTAETYDATVDNTNPTPGHLTVSDGLTTSATLAIDLVATKNVETYEPIEPGAWSDSFDDDLKLSESTDVSVSGGVLQLAGEPGPYAVAGTARSLSIAPSLLSGWTEFTWDDERPPQTTMLYRIYNGGGTALVPDAMLSGNSAGFDTPPVDLSGISTTTYSALSVHAELGTADENVTPEVTLWTVSYEEGPTPLPNLSFGLQGTKTIGSGPGGFIYKYNSVLSSGPSASVAVSNLEWDTYTITVDGATTGYDVSSSCSAQPEALAPGENQTTTLTLVPHTTHSFLVDVRSSDGEVIEGASVRLYRGAYDETVGTDPCGHVFFSGLTSGSPGGGNPYSLDVSANGFEPDTIDDVTILGTSRLSVVLNSL